MFKDFSGRRFKQVKTASIVKTASMEFEMNESDLASGSDQQKTPKRKLTSPMMDSSPSSSTSSTENVGSVVMKKKFTVTIPPKRVRGTTVLPDRGVPQWENCGSSEPRNDMGWKVRQRYQHSPKDKPPAPHSQFVQEDGGLFSQGVADKEEMDPMKYALSAVDRFKFKKTDVVKLKAEISTVVKTSEESHQSHHQMDQFLLKRGSQIENEDQVVVNQQMFEKLKYHQIEGIKFMWNACFTTNSSAGCILAHCMGLGKSLQVVALSHTVLTNAVCQVERVLIVCPVGTILNWVNEFKIWLPGNSFETLNVCELISKDTREAKITRWLNYGGIIILGYEMYLSLTKEKRSEQDELFHRALVSPGPDLLVCDEGHKLKNEISATFKAMDQISTRRRIILSGTPLQNNLHEFHTMVQFVHRGLLGTTTDFGINYVNVFEKGQMVDATELEVRAMKRRALILHKMLENTLQRFDSDVLAPFLPPKVEYVVSVRMSQLQIKLYLHYLENFTKGGVIQPTERKVESVGLLSHYQQLSRIWTHPKALKLAVNLCNTKNRPDPKTGENSEDEYHAMKKQPDLEDDLEESANPASSSLWWSKLIPDDEINNIEHSGKVLLLMDILRHCEVIGDKLLVFSQSLTSLDLVEEFLAAENLKSSAGNASAVSGTWILNTDYFRLDGSTKSAERLKFCTAFNDPKNVRARLFLISTKAGGIGINLTGANRVIIFDSSWNPSFDEQSVFRVYRLGQTKPCFIYRFVAQGTMEEKVYYRQVEKLALSRRIVDGQQMDRHFASNDLKDLYLFNEKGLIHLPDSVHGQEKALHPKDVLLSELAVSMSKWIGGYREHDSLLQSRPEEHIEIHEREAIWKLFQEKKIFFSRQEVRK